MMLLGNCEDMGCSHDDDKSSVFVSYRQAFSFHFVPFSSDFHAGIVCMNGRPIRNDFVPFSNHTGDV